MFRSSPPQRRLRQLLVALIALVTVAGLSVAQTATSAAHPMAAHTMAARPVTARPVTASTRPPAEQPVAVLLANHQVRAAPAPHARLIETISDRRPITGETTVLPIVAQQTDARGTLWLQVRLPGRPNGRTGWLKAQHTRQADIFWALTVDLATRTVTAYLDGQVVRRFPAVIGKPASPTPTGHFFVEETVALPPGTSGGPYALALSARSRVYTEFDGGPGQIAVHGRDGLGGTLGQAQSHGCVRLDDAAITWLVNRMTPGTPVTISAR